MRKVSGLKVIKGTSCAQERHVFSTEF